MRKFRFNAKFSIAQINYTFPFSDAYLGIREIRYAARYLFFDSLLTKAGGRRVVFTLNRIILFNPDTKTHIDKFEIRQQQLVNATIGSAAG